MMAMNYGSVYVAKLAFGSNDMQTQKAFLEAEAYNGPSLLICSSHCINHGYDLIHGLDQQKAAVQSGYWPLFRFNPDLVKQGKNPLQLDSRAPSLPLDKYIYNETRYSMLRQSQPEHAKALYDQAVEAVNSRWKLYEYMAAMPGDGEANGSADVKPVPAVKEEK
jgi:pyruvate-ferredoxin/flavodoxin oxidoreductase